MFQYAQHAYQFMAPNVITAGAMTSLEVAQGSISSPGAASERVCREVEGVA